MANMTAARIYPPPVNDAQYAQRAAALANMLTARPERHDQSTFGIPKRANACGTVACVAGWAQYIARDIVSVTPDGGMTWSPADLGDYRATYTDVFDGVRTLARFDLYYLAEHEARDWLGLSPDMANTLFYETNTMPMSEKLAVSILRRLGDGRLNRNGPSLFDSQMKAILAEDYPDTES